MRGADKVAHLAAADPAFTGDPRGAGPDLALVEIIDDAFDAPAMGLAAVNRDSQAGDPVERCQVIGYPAFMEREAPDGSRFRETADALGQVPVLSGLAGGLLSVQVSSSPEPLPPARLLGNSPWSGMSGGPVVAGGLLLGVVTEHAPRAGPSAITCYAADRAGSGSGASGLGAGGSRSGRLVGQAGNRWREKELIQLPAGPRPSRPEYWATVQEIRQRTGILAGRQDELAEIASFAASDEGYRLLVGVAVGG